MIDDRLSTVIVIVTDIVIVVVSGFPSLLTHVDHPKHPTDLKIWPPEAKYIEESDFDAQKSLAPPKSVENNEKPKKKSDFFLKKNFRRQKIENCKSSETRFAKVSRRSEPCSRIFPQCLVSAMFSENPLRHTSCKWWLMWLCTFFFLRIYGHGSCDDRTDLGKDKMLQSN